MDSFLLIDFTSDTFKLNDQQPNSGNTFLSLRESCQVLSQEGLLVDADSPMPGYGTVCVIT
ncbi:hypothetical protein P691DRAFT_808992 [Macrolepiota fuliginosa MF-IS2]|uniref:Uncharacterized protein n=1 Tax=Macrolepiota fuliginosa MF-IS2 TaxID=1400762 RepID=A0A9P6C750_9AGAR|nr:hypothetical protein P691DRAFT_808992 [Macrolepiota fuliginosa MF-IS2]